MLPVIQWSPSTRNIYQFGRDNEDFLPGEVGRRGKKGEERKKRIRGSRSKKVKHTA
jgi:hypothetical protein